METSLLRRCSEIPISPDAAKRDGSLSSVLPPRPFSNFLKKQCSATSLSLMDLQLAAAAAAEQQQQSLSQSWSALDRSTSPRTVQKELELLLIDACEGGNHGKAKKATKRSDLLASTSDHARSKNTQKSKVRSNHDGFSQGPLSSSSRRRSSTKVRDSQSLTSTSDRTRKVEVFPDLGPAPRSRGMWDSFSRISAHIRPSVVKPPSPINDQAPLSVSDHATSAARRKSVRRASATPAHLVTATPKRRVRFDMEVLDFYEYEGATEEEKEDFVTSKVDCKRGRKEAVAECKLYCEKNQDWVRSVEFLHSSPLKSSSRNLNISMTKEEALRAVIESEARGLETKCSQLLSRHQKWAVASVLARQVQLKLECSPVDQRWEQLRSRIASVSQCSADFARLLAEVDAEIANDIHNE